MDTALPQKFPFILDRNLAKANCRGNRVCTSCDIVVLDLSIITWVKFVTVVKFKYRVLQLLVVFLTPLGGYHLFCWLWASWKIYSASQSKQHVFCCKALILSCLCEILIKLLQWVQKMMSKLSIFCWHNQSETVLITVFRFPPHHACQQ